MQNLEHKVRELLKIPFEDIYKDLKNRGLLIQYYSMVFGSKDLCGTCSGKVKGYYNKLKNKFILKTFTMSKFRLKESVGVKQIKFGSSVFISNEIMTDELALKFLAINENRIILFEKFPEDWNGPKEKQDSDYTLNELRKMYSEEFPNVKSTSKKGFLQELEIAKAKK